MECILDTKGYLRELIISTLENRIPNSVPEDITISDLVKIAINGQMQYLMFNSLLKVAEGSDEFAYIKQALFKSTVKTYFQTIAVDEISSTFEKEGIRHQILKGAVTKKIYPSPEMREMSDIDLVVYDESLEKAAQIMENLGYKNHGLIKHHMIFSKGNEVIVEVHWCLFDANAGKEQYVYFKDNFRAKLKKGTDYTYEFSFEDFYVYMIAHIAKHFFETGCGIRNLVDIYIYISKYGKIMNIDYLKNELSKCGILDFEKNMRKLAFVWLEGREWNTFCENLFEYMVNSGIYGKAENGIWSQLAKETAGGNKNIKMHYYFPSIYFMREKYKWLNEKPYLLPIAWVIRGATGFTSKTSRKHKNTFENADKEEVEKMLDIYHRLNLNFRR